MNEVDFRRISDRRAKAKMTLSSSIRWVRGNLLNNTAPLSVASGGRVYEIRSGAKQAAPVNGWAEVSSPRCIDAKEEDASDLSIDLEENVDEI